MYLKLNRPALIESTWREKGHVFQADGRYAETMVRSGAASPVPPSVETATVEPRGERAVAGRQR